MHACNIHQYLIRQNVFFLLFRQDLLLPIIHLIWYDSTNQFDHSGIHQSVDVDL